MSVAALETMGYLVGAWMVPVSRVAGVLGASWHTAHGGFVRVADQADQAEAAEAAGSAPADAGDADAGDAGDAEAGEEPAGEADAAAGPKTRRSVSGPLPEMSVLGLDDHRRGRPR